FELLPRVRTPGKNDSASLAANERPITIGPMCPVSLIRSHLSHWFVPYLTSHFTPDCPICKLNLPMCAARPGRRPVPARQLLRRRRVAAAERRLRYRRRAV